MSDTLIEVNNLHKKFTRSLKRSMLYGSVDIGRSMLGIQYDPGELRKGEFWVLQGVDFKLERGQTIGLMGANGSGKSTLLRMLNGIFPPDRGEIMIKGRIGALIAVGAGFHPHMSGRENVYLNGSILGMKKQEIDKKLDSIIDFADIGDFIDSPVATYSSGMSVRLGFSIAIHADIDILLADEILAVGDANFQKKCFEKILELRRNGVSTVLVSHAVSQLERLCTVGLFLDKGKQAHYGEIRETVKAYFEHLNVLSRRDGDPHVHSAVSVGVGNVSFSNPKVYQADGSPNSPEIEFGKDIVIEFDYEFKQKPSSEYQMRVSIRTAEGHDVQKMIFQEQSLREGKKYINEHTTVLEQAGHFKVRLKAPKLFPQTYLVDMAVQSLRIDVHEGGIANAARFTVVEPQDHSLYFEYGNMSTDEYDYEEIK